MDNNLSPLFRRLFVCLSVALCASLMLTLPAFGQVTTGTLAGAVTAQGDALPGVTVEATHLPTNTRYSGVTGPNGRFVIPNVRVGGPFRVTASLEGFRNEDETGIEVKLGETAEVPAMKMQLAAVTEAITVTATADELINPNRTGSTSTVSIAQIENLPTVNRTLQDFARTNPYFRVDPTDGSGTLMNVAGRNNRYNSIQIDGAVNNDLFGLAASGTPGGQSDAQPISLDAIEQLQLVVSPYDVRQGGFTGGGINAVTRSGTNDIRFSVFGTQRSEQFVGDGPLDRPISTFEQDQYGGRVGGPLMRDRLFFFASAEMNRRSAPTGVSAAGDAPTQVNPTLLNALGRVVTVLGRYNYDPGSLGEIQAQTDNDTVFGRLDFNVASHHQLTLRHNYNEAGRDNLGPRSASRFTFPNTNYRQANETNSTVGQLNSVFNSNTFNELRLTYQTIKDKRAVPAVFPSIEIGGASQNATIAAGTERFSGANALDQNISEFTDDFIWLRGSHTLVFGTHNEFFEFKNLFMSDALGAYFFGPNDLTAALAAFEANRPTEYRITFATGSDPRRPTEFKAAQLGLYASDQFRVSNNLTLIMGLRADMPRYPEKPSFNPVVETAIGYRTDATPTEDPVISPRFGFNWNPHRGGNQQVRGGIGIFAGRTPFVWVSNAYAGTGVEQVSLTCLASANCPVPAFTPDPLTQPRNVGTAGAPGTLTVDLVDPDFQFPRILRSTLGYDRDLWFGIRGTAEVIYSQTQQDVFYLNANRRQLGTNAIDGRPTYTKVDTAQLSDAYFLTNTSKGKDMTVTVQFMRPFTNGVTMGVNYAWQDAQSAFDATSSRAVSNWRFRHTAGDIFKDDVSNSAFEVEQRLNANLSYAFRTGPLAHTFGFYYNMQAGRPFSMIQGNDANLDLNVGNDLLYLPAPGQVIFEFSNAAYRRGTHPATGLTAEQAFEKFMKAFGAGATDGRVTDRYEFQEPWTRRLDFHYELGLPIRGFETSVTLDVLNALNLIDKDAGTVRFIINQNTTIATIVGTDTATGKPIYREAGNERWNSDTLFSIADISSRWQGRLGLRITF